MKSISHSHALGNYIDNLYHNTSDGSRKLTLKHSGNVITASYQTIAQCSRDQGLHIQTDNLKFEANDIINKKVEELKKGFKEDTGSAIKLTRINENSNHEVMSTSSMSPIRRIRFIYSVQFEVQD
jgi:hypothetical protein